MDQSPDAAATTSDPLPELSVVVTIYDMAREAPRTLYSLSADHQVGISADQYEVIVVDNGSKTPIGSAEVEKYGPNFRLLRIDNATRSPAPAMNRGVEMAAGRFVGLIIDGARMATPGLLSNALAALADRPTGVVETLGYILGPDLMDAEARASYDAASEDQALDRIEWRTHGYRLFEIATFAPSSSGGWYGQINESSCLFMERSRFLHLDGYDERFDRPGGGYVSADFYQRAVASADVEPCRLLGEATFHQMHGGAATGVSRRRRKLRAYVWHRQYRRLRGTRFRPQSSRTVFWGDADVLDDVARSTQRGGHVD